MPIMSLPLMMTGIACAWIGNGTLNWNFASAARIASVSPACSHFSIGAGTLSPRTFILSNAFRRSCTSVGVSAFKEAAST
eukprot:gene13175-biopygen13225